jgi:hypothetical protein
MDVLLPISCSISAINGGYVISVPGWSEDGEPITDFCSYTSLPNALKFIKQTIEQLDSQAKESDDRATVEGE